MAFCPNCGAENNSGKFCCNCGSPLPVSQPVQTVQPEQPVAQPVQQAAQPVVMQPVMEPVAQPAAPQPVMQPVMEPVMEPVVAPVYQESVQNVYSKAVAPVEGLPKMNSMCKTGFTLSMIGLCCVGLTCPFGLIFSIIGIFDSKKKKERGRGLGIAGTIVSAFLLFVVIFNFAYLRDEYSALFEKIAGESGFTTTHTTADDEDDDDDDNDDDDDVDSRVELVTSVNWIETHEDSYLTFGRRDSFKYYKTYEDTTDNYFSGKYEIYFGEKAIKVVDEDYEEYGLTKDEMENMLDNDPSYTKDNFIAVVLKNDGMWVDGVNTKDEEWTSVYVGFFIEKPDYELHLLNIGTATYYDFVPENDFERPAATSATEETASETTETTATGANSDFSGYEYFGDDIAGYVYLTQGNWEVWYEAGVNADDYDALYQRINTDTMSIINISVFAGTYDSSTLPVFADTVYSNMSSDGGYTGVKIEETVFGGYKAYNITGVYEDGTNLSIWLFLDNKGKMHYNSIEYLDNDKASYNMFVETYTLN